jgi:hypothetical protein
MIRGVVIHVSNEQPLLADLYDVPSPGDVGLVCTNIRMLDGKQPIFIDHTDSTFFFPNLHLRFIEITASEMAKHLAETGGAPGVAATRAAAPARGAGPTEPERSLPAVIAMPAGADEVPDIEQEPDGDLDIDEDFLRRVRDI